MAVKRLPSGKLIEVPDGPLSEEDRKRLQRALELDQQSIDQQPQPQGPTPEQVLQNLGGLGGGARDIPSGELPKIVQEAALPVAGEIAGAAIAGPIGESAGGVVGEALNQLFGITPKSRTQLFLAGAAGPVTRIAGKLLKKGTRLIPGAGAGIQEKAIDDIAKLGLDIVPGGATPSGELFKEVAKANPFISMRRTLNAVDELLDQARRSSTPDTGLIAKLENLKGKITSAGRIDPSTLKETGRNGLFFSDLQAEISDFGALQGKLNPNEAKFKFIGRSLREDLEVAGRTLPGNPGFKLRAANKAFSREKFQEGFMKFLDDPSVVSPPRESDGLVKINTLAILKRLQGKQFRITRKTLPDQFKDVVKTVEAIRVANVPLPPPGGVPIGSGLNVLRGSIGGALGGGISRTGEGATVGAFLGVVVPEFISKAMTTDLGRKFIRFLVRDKSPLTVQSIAAGLQAVRNVDEFQPVIDLMDSIIQEKQQGQVDIGKVITPSAPFQESRETSFRNLPFEEKKQRLRTLQNNGR